jgi:hypothetical protein
MSERSKMRRKARDEKEKKEGAKIVNWIFGILIFLAVCFAVYSMWLVD